MNGNQDRVATMVVRVEGIDSVQRVAAATTVVVAAARWNWYWLNVRTYEAFRNDSIFVTFVYYY